MKIFLIACFLLASSAAFAQEPDSCPKPTPSPSSKKVNKITGNKPAGIVVTAPERRYRREPELIKEVLLSDDDGAQNVTRVHSSHPIRPSGESCEWSKEEIDGSKKYVDNLENIEVWIFADEEDGLQISAKRPRYALEFVKHKIVSQSRDPNVTIEDLRAAILPCLQRLVEIDDSFRKRIIPMFGLGEESDKRPKR